MDTGGNVDPACIRECFNAGRDIDAFPVNVPPVIDDVAEVYPHTKLQCVGRQSLLECYRTLNGILGRRKLDEETIAGEFDDPSAVIAHDRVYNAIPGCFPRSNSTVGILLHQPCIARHISSENGSEPALYGLIRHLPGTGLQGSR